MSVNKIVISKKSLARVPVRKLTYGPGYHWFAYYDKLQFSPEQRYLLSMKADFRGRSPRCDDIITVGMLDLDADYRWIELGQSCAWCWQQGCMLQWIPSSDDKVIWNDRQNDKFVCHVVNVHTGESYTLPFAIYSLSPDGLQAVTTDFRRINDTRPGYGYTGLPDPNKTINAPENSGIWQVNLHTGQSELIISLAQVAYIPWPHGDLSNVKHWFNHLLINPEGTRFIFLNRWHNPETRQFQTRMFTANLDGSDIRIVCDSGMVSHFNWRGPNHIIAFAKPAGERQGFYLFDERTGHHEMLLEAKDGHCSYLPGNEWILSDTYAMSQNFIQNLYLFNPQTGRHIELGGFYQPQDFDWEWRCDLHPRFSPDGKHIVIDSTHDGDGRQMYMLDISNVYC